MMRRLAGYSLLSLALVALTTLLAATAGWIPAIVMMLGCLLFTGICVLGVWLISN